MAKKKQTWKMHFNKGIPCTWVGDPYDEEVDNFVFEEDLYIDGCMRGCSSAVMLLRPYKDKDKEYKYGDLRYQVFMSDIEDIVKNMVNGRIKALFTWVKKGDNYGIKFYGNIEDENKRDEILKNIISFLKERDIDHNEFDYSYSTNLYKDLNIDSLDRVELVMDMECKFHILIPDEDAERMRTIGDLVNFIKEHEPR